MLHFYWTSLGQCNSLTGNYVRFLKLVQTTQFAFKINCSFIAFQTKWGYSILFTSSPRFHIFGFGVPQLSAQKGGRVTVFIIPCCYVKKCFRCGKKIKMKQVLLYIRMEFWLSEIGIYLHWLRIILVSNDRNCVQLSIPN